MFFSISSRKTTFFILHPDDTHDPGSFWRLACILFKNICEIAMIIVSYHFTYFVYFVSFLSRPFALSIRKFIQTDILIIFSRSEIILKNMVLLLLTLTSGKIMKRLNHLKNTHKKPPPPQLLVCKNSDF